MNMLNGIARSIRSNKLMVTISTLAITSFYSSFALAAAGGDPLAAITTDMNRAGSLVVNALGAVVIVAAIILFVSSLFAVVRGRETLGDVAGKMIVGALGAVFGAALIVLATAEVAKIV